jgi:magnesium chelatase family protein
MSLAMVRSRALIGLQAPEVQVEVHLANGLPAFHLVGLADTEVKESRERVRAALGQAGHPFPHNKRVTVSLAPADLPKDSGRFDLPIALGILAAAGTLDAAKLDACEFAGELSLAGELRPVRGALAIAMGLKHDGAGRELVLPPASAARAAHVSGITVRTARTLAEVVASLMPGEDTPSLDRLDLPPEVAPGSLGGPDLREVRGQAAPRRALEIAAAGRHSLLMVGPPGSGKSMLAERLPALLPPMTDDEALASAAVQDLAGAGFTDSGWRQRPFRAPHHSASAVALVGGGQPPRPGEVSLAHAGVLFLDELPEYPRAALEALREPLEARRITISRAARQAQFPAAFQLISAMNPCPCGWLGAQWPGRSCRCTPDQIARYQARLSGPLLDRIDLQVEVAAVPADQLMRQPDGESSQAVAQRVAGAARRQQDRQGCANAELDAGQLHTHAALNPEARELLTQAATRLGWTGRGLHRATKVARTIADLASSEAIAPEHVAEAMQYRRALPAG